MKSASRYFIPAVLAAVALSACDSGEPSVNRQKECPDFTATIGDALSRASDSSWDAGDQIGITGAGRSNVAHVTSDGRGNFSVASAGQQIYFEDEAEVTFTAYYPWSESEGEIKADTRGQSEQKTFDFLWAAANGKKDAPDVRFRFDHKMAKVQFTLRPGTAMSFDEVKSAKLTLSGLRHTGSFNTATGTTTVDNAGEAWTLSADFATVDPTGETLTFSLILFPQVFANSLEFNVELALPDNRLYNLKADLDFTAANRKIDGDAAKNEWVAGRQYNLSLTLHKTELTLGSCEISPWVAVEGDEIDVD